MTHEKSVDESWKENAAKDKEQVAEAPLEQEEEMQQFDFRSYITSLAMQALIFMGIIPNPMDGNKMEMNLDQSRLLIDTLGILREKTKGNLTKEEEGLLNTMLFELQTKFVEISNNKNVVVEDGKINA